AIAAGDRHSLGLKSDGSIVQWGINLEEVPAPNSGFVAIAAGSFYSLARRADGSIAAWGLKDAAQVTVPSPNIRYVAMSAAYEHALAVQAPPIGACYLPGDCSQMTPSECTTAGGQWLGEDVTCEADSDGDEIPDCLELCPGTVAAAPVGAD